MLSKLALVFCLVHFVASSTEGCDDYVKFFKNMFNSRAPKPFVIPIDLKSLESYDPMIWFPDVKMNFNKLGSPKSLKGFMNLEAPSFRGFSSGTGSISITFPTTGIYPVIDIDFKNFGIHSNYTTEMVAFEMLKASADNGEAGLPLPTMKFYWSLKIDILKGYEIPISLEILDMDVIGDVSVILTKYFGDKEKSRMIGEEIGDLINMIVNHDLIKSIGQKYLQPLLNMLLYLFDVSPKNIIEWITGAQT